MGLAPIGPLKLKAQLHHGKGDRLVEFVPNAWEIVAVLRKDGVTAELCTYERAGHGFVGADADNTKASVDSKASTLAFFEKHL
jgi:dipeptidyl aminopeptidase/acylaminoacyl peptidase